MQIDTYALGATLLNCLFLDQLTPPSILAGSLKKYEAKWGFVGILREMVS
jgi:hypothetical protein